MNRLKTEKRVQVLSALVEGCSIRATVRMIGVAKNTIAKLLVDVGRACESYQDRVLRELPCDRVQTDEIWSFCYSKQKNVPEHLRRQVGIGDVWTWVAMDSDSKLVISWLLGKRDAGYANAFMQDVASRLANRVQLTTDGFSAYLTAVRNAFRDNIDYAQLVKMYGPDPKDNARYSPPKCNGTRKNGIIGFPDVDHISTSHIERQNLTMRMAMRRFTRLTNGFSKKFENQQHAVALHFMHYNFCRVHQTLKMTPAMAAAVADRTWTLEDVVGLIETEKPN